MVRTVVGFGGRGVGWCDRLLKSHVNSFGPRPKRTLSLNILRSESWTAHGRKGPSSQVLPWFRLLPAVAVLAGLRCDTGPPTKVFLLCFIISCV